MNFLSPTRSISSRTDTVSNSPELTPLPDGNILNGGVSHWFQQTGIPTQRPPLGGNREVDVAIVGAGMTGLWTAYYLKKADPSLRIAIIERRFAGYGASGRNGGWLSGEPAGLFRHYVRDGGADATKALQRRMFQTVDEVLSVMESEDIDADAVKDGLMYVATNPAQESRLRARFDGLLKQGWTDDDLEWLNAAEVSKRVHVAGAVSGYRTPHCARIDPAKLMVGLAKAVEKLGVAIYEGTTAIDLQPKKVLTDRGVVRADVVVRALEGYTGSLRGEKRTLIPMNSSMVVTEPLTTEVWAEIGWNGAHLLGDSGHSYCYMQRTADGRLTIGGRGVPYNFASRFDPAGRTATKAILQLRQHMRTLFPATRDVQLHHSWSGVLGVPRDWSSSISYEKRGGLVLAGGYSGHGVSGTNLAARTVRDLVLGADSELTSLPWVNHHSGRWEPEPIRWIGASSLYTAYRYADRAEARTGRPSKIGHLADLVSGRH